MYCSITIDNMGKIMRFIKVVKGLFLIVVVLLISGFTIPQDVTYRKFEQHEFNNNNKKYVAKINRIAWYTMDMNTKYYILNDLSMKWSPLPNKVNFPSKYVLLCDLKEFAVGFYIDNILVDWCNILAGSSTPHGIFKPGIYDRDHESSLYKMPDGRNAPMPNAIQFSGNFFVHGGDVIAGENLSHGCINVPNYFMEWVYYKTINCKDYFLIVVK
jgi:hypothetical protein